MYAPLSFSDLEALARVDDDVVEVRPPPQNVAGTSSNPTISSTAVGITVAGSSTSLGVVATGSTLTRQQVEKRRELEAKGRSQVKNPLKRPSIAQHESAKKLKESAAKRSAVDISVNDFVSYIKVGKYGKNMFIKWNSEAVDREKVKSLKPKIYGLKLTCWMLRIS